MGIIGGDDLIFLRKNFEVYNLNFFYFSKYLGKDFWWFIVYVIKIVNRMKEIKFLKK